MPIGNLFFAANGKEALAMLDSQWVDLIFTDINMPRHGRDRDDREALCGRSAQDTSPVVIVST